VGLLPVLPRHAAANQAAGLVRALGEATISMLREAALSGIERRARFRALVERGFDLPTIARLALGPRWKVMGEDERRAYVSLFRDYVLETYARRLDEYRGQSLRVGEVVRAGQDEVVESWLDGGGEPVRVDWRVRATPAGPRIVDVVVAGVSMVLTQRSEFATIIEREGGVPGLMAHLRRRAAPGGQTGAG
jgi:phospholipid transport system substrate-binding protein